MSGFSPEIRREKKAEQKGRCALIGLEIDFLEGHHAIPKMRGGSNNKHNCIEVSGEKSYCAYGVPVPDIHEVLDRLAIDFGLYLHPDKLILVTSDLMPSDCFISPQIRSQLVDFDHQQRNYQKNPEQIFAYRSVIPQLIPIHQELIF